jgi:hypothetical protein
VPTATYEKIASTTLGSANATITFSSIPATYTDLRLVVTGTSNFTHTTGMQFNGDTGTNYSETRLEGDGATATSAGNTGVSYLRFYGFTTTPTMFTVDLFSYAGSTNKTSLGITSADLNGSGNVRRYAQLWRSTSAINSISFGPGVSGASGTTYSIGTTATLYGILKA